MSNKIVQKLVGVSDENVRYKHTAHSYESLFETSHGSCQGTYRVLEASSTTPWGNGKVLLVVTQGKHYVKR